ncbi:Aste57867_2246 [Aphanomyces stellatus]|uniref:Aste57867_2246 protein n=1 Tax=Aphanomyces stellatus TaxID=120398 RepID=A0A485K747_9STRA|nr:hypothetical protein As57867_002241 [Aphanomyces stellatus]VFT79449.1 Aste57867_2246 [Aphanomyces stellatus]
MSSSKPSSNNVNLRLNMRFPVPPHATAAQVLAVFRGPTWVDHVVRHVVPYLKSSSPAKRALVRNLEPCPCDDDADCVICMSDIRDEPSSSGVALACGHRFHRACIASWLGRKSTCPTCRFQFETEYAGKYAFKYVETRLTVDNDETLGQSLGGHDVPVTVYVCLAPMDKTSSEPTPATFKCDVRASIVSDMPKPQGEEYRTTQS